MHFLQSRITSRKLFNALSSRQGQHKFLAVYKSQSGDDEKQNKTYLYQIPPWMKKNTVEKHPESSEVQKDVLEKFNENKEEGKSNLEKEESQQTFNEINIQEMTRCKSVYKIKRRLSPIPKKVEPPKPEKRKDFEENVKNETKHDFFSRPPPVESPFKVLQSKSLKFPPRVDPFPAATELFNFKEPLTMPRKFETKNSCREPEKRILKTIKKVDEIVKKIDAHKLAFNIAEKERNLKETKKIDFKKIPIKVQEIEKNVKEMLKKKTVLNALDKDKKFFNNIPENNEIIRKPSNKIEVDKKLKEMLLLKKAAKIEKAPERPKNEELKKHSPKILLKDENLDVKGKSDFLFPKSVEDKRRVWKEILENFESESEKPLKNQLVVELTKKPLKFSSKEMLFPKEQKKKNDVPKKKSEKTKIEKTIKNDVDTKNMEVLSPKIDKMKNPKDKKHETFNESIANLRKEGERLRMEFEKNKKKHKKPKRLTAILYKDAEKTKQPKILSTKKSLRKKRKLRKTNVKRSQRVKTDEKSPKPIRSSMVLKKGYDKPQVKDKVLSNWTSQIPDRLILPKYSSNSVFDNSFTKPEEPKEIGPKETEEQEVIKINEPKLQEVKINELKDVNDAAESIYCVAVKPEEKEVFHEPILNMADRTVEFERLPKQIKDALIRIHSDDKNKNEFDIMRKTFENETEVKEKIDNKALINVDKPKIKIEPTGFGLFQKRLQNIILKYKCCFQTAIRTWDMIKKINNEKQKSSILIFGGGKVLNKIKNQKRSKTKKEKGKCAKKSGYNINMKHKSSLFQNLQNGRDKKILLAEGPKPKKTIILRNSKHKKAKKANNLTKIKRKAEMKKIAVKPASEPVKIDAHAPGMSYSEILTAVFSNKSISAHFKK